MEGDSTAFRLCSMSLDDRPELTYLKIMGSGVRRRTPGLAIARLRLRPSTQSGQLPNRAGRLRLLGLIAASLP